MLKQGLSPVHDATRMQICQAARRIQCDPAAAAATQQWRPSLRVAQQPPQVPACAVPSTQNSIFTLGADSAAPSQANALYASMPAVLKYAEVCC